MSLEGQVPLPICKKCWIDKHFGYPMPVDNPQEATCVYCGDQTTFGVYVWDSPTEVPFYTKTAA